MGTSLTSVFWGSNRTTYSYDDLRNYLGSETQYIKLIINAQKIILRNYVKQKSPKWIYYCHVEIYNNPKFDILI